MIVLVLGGARSGKSEFAEQLATTARTAVTYVATGLATDPEMAHRIAAHRERRPDHWATVECEPSELTLLLKSASGTVLIDSLGTWVARHDNFAVDVRSLCAALQARCDNTIVVSEEVGMAVHPPTESGRRFGDALGALNTAVSSVADDAFLVVAGRVLPLELPTPWFALAGSKRPEDGTGA